MSSNDETVISPFGQMLDDVLAKNQITYTQLAKETQVSRTNLITYRSKALPRTKTLATICEKLIEKKVPSRDLIPLICSGIGISLPNAKAFYSNLPFPFDHQAKADKVRELKTRCLVTDIIAERVHQGILEETLSNLACGVEYYYFVPKSCAAREWTQVLLSAKHLGIRESDLDTKQIHVIACPDGFISTRMRVDNIFEEDCEVWVSLGTEADSQLMRIDPRVTATFVTILRIAIQEAQLAYERDEPFSYIHEEEGMSLQFECINGPVRNIVSASRNE